MIKIIFFVCSIGLFILTYSDCFALMSLLNENNGTVFYLLILGMTFITAVLIYFRYRYYQEMKRCPDEKTIVSYAEGILPEDIKKRVQRHLVICVKCSGRNKEIVESKKAGKGPDKK